MASFPDKRITPMAPTPGGVERATMVSEVIMGWFIGVWYSGDFFWFGYPWAALLLARLPFGSAQGALLFSWFAYPSAPLRARKIRSLSGAEAPDFREVCDKLLRFLELRSGCALRHARAFKYKPIVLKK
jgi:hypothetical protein